MEGMDRDITVQLSYAGDMIMLIQRGLLECGKVERIEGEVEELELVVSSSGHAPKSPLIDGQG